MKRSMNIDLGQAQRSYSAKAVMQILKIGPEELRRLEKTGKLKLSSRQGTLPGYPGEQVDDLLRVKKNG